jgi:uncharacterized integral membrane protein
MSENLSQGKSRNYLVLAVWGVVAVLLLLFIANNSQNVELNFLFTETTWPLWLLVVVIFALGAAGGWVTKWWTGRSAK